MIHVIEGIEFCLSNHFCAAQFNFSVKPLSPALVTGVCPWQPSNVTSHHLFICCLFAGAPRAVLFQWRILNQNTTLLHCM